MKLGKLAFGGFITTINAGLVCDPVPNPGANTICGSPGQLKHNPRFSVGPFTTSFTRCVQLLGEARYQYSTAAGFFLYNYASAKCTIYDARLTEQKFIQNVSSNTRFYDQRCFDCSVKCPGGRDPQLMNNIINGNFELSKTTLFPFDQAYGDKLVSPGRESKTMLTCALNASSCGLHAQPPACPHQQYSFAFDYLIQAPPNFTTRPTISVTYADLQLTVLGGSRPEVNNTWRRHYGSITHDVEFGRSNEFYLGTGTKPHGTHMYYVDNLSAFPIKTPIQTKFGAKSLVANGGFENGELAPWKVLRESVAKAGVSIIKPGYHSKYALYYTNDGLDDFVTLIQKIPNTVPGTTYVFAFNYKVTDPGLRFVATSAGVSGVYSKSGWSLFPVSKPRGGWQRFERLVTIFEHQVHVEVTFTNQYTHSCLLDNVTLIEVGAIQRKE